jgi:diguanylate cyclase (GGDEF)-like protein
LAKERAELEHKVAATTDPLTGIANRRAFLEGAQRSLQQRSRMPQPVSVLLFDLDRFKSINDRYGHAAGDRVLRAFADVAVIELRSTDLLGRLGGEEFGAILFGAEASSAAATAERIRSVFAAGYAGEGGTNDEISVSVGVASVPADEKIEIEALMLRADEALYVAKARGRNRVEVADGYAPRSGGRDLAEPVGGHVKQGPIYAPGAAASPGLVPAQSGFGELADIAGAVRQKT